MSTEITLTELSKMYGYSLPAVTKWKERGLPFNSNTRRCPREKAIAWVIENIISPLREVDVQAQIQQEKLRKARGEADAIERENQEAMNLLIPVGYVEQELAEYCGKVKQTILQIATIDVLEVLESATDQKTLKNKLREIIERRLNEVGDIFENADLGEDEEEELPLTEESEQEPEEDDEFDVS
ncbi:TPA: terminase small subunit [Escherichia coli]|nr:terminase small subunit [Escherichia coli]